MSAASSPGSAVSTAGSRGLGFDTRSSVSRILGGEGCLRSGSPESPSTTTYELFVSNQRREVRQMEVAPSLTEPGGFTQSPFLLISQEPISKRLHDPRGLAPTLQAGQCGAMSPWIYSAAASPAKTSPSPAAAPDSKQANDPPSSSSSPDVPMSLFGPEGMSSLRTYPDYFPARADEISPSYSRRWPSSGFTTSPGVCWTADISECPSGGGVSSSLADVLQDGVAARYFLSPRAAAGILRRAEKRGRGLPSHLSAALEQVARTTTTPKQDES